MTTTSLETSNHQATRNFDLTKLSNQHEPDLFIDAVAFMSSYYSLTLLLIGCLCNPLSFCVLSRRAFRGSAMSVYLRFLTVSDTTALLLGLLRFFMLSTFDVTDLRVNLIGCHVHIWLVNISFYSSSWTLVIVTLERVVSIVWPHKVKIICTKSTSKIIVGIIVLVWAAILANHFVLFGHLLVSVPARNETFVRHCVIVYNREVTNKVYWIFDGINFALLPTCFLAVSNIIIAMGVVKSRRRVEKTSNKSNASFASSTQAWAATTAEVEDAEHRNAMTDRGSYDCDDYTSNCREIHIPRSNISENSNREEINYSASHGLQDSRKCDMRKTASYTEENQPHQNLVNSHVSGHQQTHSEFKTGYRNQSQVQDTRQNTQAGKQTLQRVSKPAASDTANTANTYKVTKSLKSNKETSLTLTLMAINMCYVICTFPICAFEVGPHHQTTVGLGQYGEAITKVLLMLAYTNNALNFFLYCLTGTRFRSELKALVTDVFLCCREQ